VEHVPVVRGVRDQYRHSARVSSPRNVGVGVDSVAAWPGRRREDGEAGHACRTPGGGLAALEPSCRAPRWPRPTSECQRCVLRVGR
jgi:hypothetical protein